jgi:hypothetical protein
MEITPLDYLHRPRVHDNWLYRWLRHYLGHDSSDRQRGFILDG